MTARTRDLTAHPGSSGERTDAIAPLAELADAVTRVPLVDGSTTRFVNFDYAASAPPLASVHRAVTAAMAHYASIHRGQSYLSRVSTAAYERARVTVADRTGARPDDVDANGALSLVASEVSGPAAAACRRRLGVVVLARHPPVISCQRAAATVARQGSGEGPTRRLRAGRRQRFWRHDLAGAVKAMGAVRIRRSI